eukprot:3489136-Prymnesium_polylepis.1
MFVARPDVCLCRKSKSGFLCGTDAKTAGLVDFPASVLSAPSMGFAITCRARQRHGASLKRNGAQ